MSIANAVFEHTSFLARELAAEKEELLAVACQAAVSSLQARMRDNVRPEDCRSDFIMAAGMYAMAAITELDSLDQVEQLTAGDVTVRRGSKDGAANYLRTQAEVLMAPYLKQPLVFLGV